MHTRYPSWAVAKNVQFKFTERGLVQGERDLNSDCWKPYALCPRAEGFGTKGLLQGVQFSNLLVQGFINHALAFF